MTSTAAEAKRRNRSFYLFFALIFAFGAFPLAALLSNSAVIASAASLAVAVSFVLLGPPLHLFPAPRTGAGRSEIYRPASLDTRAALEPVLAGAILRAGHTVASARVLTRLGSTIEWRLELPVKVVYKVRISSMDTGPFWISVTTIGLQNQSEHQRLKGQILESLAAAAGPGPEPAGRSAA